MPKFGEVPKEVPVERRLDQCAPKFVDAVNGMLRDLRGQVNAMAFETLRTEARQGFLYGFGRTYDDGRGKVTNAPSALNSWHAFGLAADVVEKDKTPWDAPVSFWEAIASAAEANGLASGARWKKPDRPHVQWAKCPPSPTDEDRALLKAKGMQAVWKKYSAA